MTLACPGRLTLQVGLKLQWTWSVGFETLDLPRSQVSKIVHVSISTHAFDERLHLPSASKSIPVAESIVRLPWPLQVAVSSSSYPELLAGIRGAGTVFGIVTELTFQLFKITSKYIFDRIYTACPL